MVRGHLVEWLSLTVAPGANLLFSVVAWVAEYTSQTPIAKIQTQSSTWLAVDTCPLLLHRIHVPPSLIIHPQVGQISLFDAPKIRCVLLDVSIGYVAVAA